MVLGLNSRRKVLVQTDEGKKAVSMVEGSGVFVCHIHDFLTEDKIKFDLHCKEEGHFYGGRSRGHCVMCNKLTYIKGIPFGQNPICDQCTLKLADQTAAAKRRLAEMRKK